MAEKDKSESGDCLHKSLSRVTMSAITVRPGGSELVTDADEEVSSFLLPYIHQR